MTTESDTKAPSTITPSKPSLPMSKKKASDADDEGSFVPQTQAAIDRPKAKQAYSVTCQNPGKGSGPISEEIIAIDPTDAMAFFVAKYRIDPTDHRVRCEKCAA